MCCSPWGCKELDMTGRLNNIHMLIFYPTRGIAGRNCIFKNLILTSYLQKTTVVIHSPNSIDSAFNNIPLNNKCHIFLKNL